MLMWSGAVLYCLLFSYGGNAQTINPADRFYTETPAPTAATVHAEPLVERDPPPYQSGWPVSFGGWIWNAVSFIDADCAGNLEVLGACVVSGAVHMKNHDGTNFPGWPVSFGQYNYGAPVAGDVDGNGMMEVFTGANTNTGCAALYGWQTTGSVLPGFPVYFAAGSQVNSGPVLSDLDYDGDLEIVFSLYQGDSTYVFHHDGTRLQGWPQASPSNVRDAPVVGDLDGDGDLEVIVVSATQLYVWHDDGAAYTGFPVAIGAYYSDGLAMGDLDGDGYGEIIVNTVDAVNNVHVYDHQGSMVSGWPRSTGASLYAEPCLGDLDNDGDLEIVIGATGSGIQHVYAWHHNGNQVSGWPAHTSMDAWCQSSAAIGDIDNDGDIEVIIGSDDHKVYAFHHDATPVADWPVTGPTDQVSAPVTLGDIDRDGDIEAGVGSLDDMVHIWDLSATLEAANVEWQTYHHDHWFTGWYHPKPPTGLGGMVASGNVELEWSENTEPDLVGYNVYRSQTSGYPYACLTDQPVLDASYTDSTVIAGNTYYYVVTACIKAGSESRYSAEVAIPVTGIEELAPGIVRNGFWFASPARGSTTIQFTLASSGRVTIHAYNALGQIVATPASAFFDTGAHSVVWNATDDTGSDLPGGIYFLNLSTAQYTATRTLLIIR